MPAPGALGIKGLFIALLVIVVVLPVRAQQVLSIAAVVNDEVISFYDVEQRVTLVIASTGLQSTRAIQRRLRRQVINDLIEEKLQLQEAQRLNIGVSAADVERAFAFIENQNKLAPGRIDAFLASRNIEKSALERQLRAEIAWAKVIRRRLNPSLAVSEDEVDEVIARMERSAGQPEFLVGEIFLAVASPTEEADVKRRADDLVEELRRGAVFPAVARQFSQGVTAGIGGEVGWVEAGQLAEELDQVLREMKVGQVTPPIRSSGGFYILALRDRRMILAVDDSEVEVTLKQIFLPLTRNTDGAEIASQRALANTIADSIQNCEDVDRLTAALRSPESGDLGTVRLSELPPDFRSAVASLAVGKPSEPVVAPTGVHIFVVCERNEPKAKVPDRAAIAEQLGRTRLAMMARRYLRDLRRDAVVELR